MTTVWFSNNNTMIKMDVFGTESIQKIDEKVNLYRLEPPEKRPIIGGTGGVRYPVYG